MQPTAVGRDKGVEGGSGSCHIKLYSALLTGFFSPPARTFGANVGRTRVATPEQAKEEQHPSRTFQPH